MTIHTRFSHVVRVSLLYIIDSVCREYRAIAAIPIQRKLSRGMDPFRLVYQRAYSFFSSISMIVGEQNVFTWEVNLIQLHAHDNWPLSINFVENVNKFYFPRNEHLYLTGNYYGKVNIRVSKDIFCFQNNRSCLLYTSPSPRDS